MNIQTIIVVGLSVAAGMLVGHYRAYIRGRRAFRMLLSSAVHSTTTMANAAVSLLIDELKITKEDAMQKLLNRCRDHGMSPVAITASGKEMKPDVNSLK